MSIDIQAEIRRFVKNAFSGASKNLRMSAYESLAVAQVEPANAELTRAGRRFFLGVSASPTGIAPVQAIPTTAAQWVIWNPDPVAAYLIEELGMLLASGTPGLGGSMWFTLFTSPAQVGANATGMTVQSASLSGRSSKAIVKSGVTITTPTAPPWMQLAQSSDSVTAAAFSTGYANGFLRTDLAGAIAIPPSCGLGLAVLAPAGTTPLYIPYARWAEAEVELE